MVEPMIPWLEEIGIEACLPLERMAGVDEACIRKSPSRWRMIGAYDKTAMRRREVGLEM
jgi:hypothetical protein